MKSKTSFFDRRVSLHLLRRFWPLFLLWLAILLLAGPVGLNVNAHQEPARVITDLRSDLLSSGRGAVWLSALMGALMAMGMLSYLYFPRDCGLINSLPLRRETVYFTAVLTGLVPMLLTDVLVFALLWLFYGQYGAGARYFLWWLEMTLLANAGFYGFACFCGTLTGNVLVLPAVYVVLNCAVAVFEAAVRGVFTALLYGYTFDSLMLEWASPLLWLTDHAESTVLTHMEAERGIAADYAPIGLGYLAGLCAAGIVFALLGALVIRRRHMETAGEVVAVPSLRPVFRACMALGCGMLGSMVLVEEFLRGLYGTGKFATLALSMCAFAALGWFAAEMLMKKTLRVFDHGWREIGVLCAGLLVFAVLTKLDVAGYETRIPAAEDIESIDMTYMASSGITERESIDAWLDFHRGIIAHRERNEAAESGPWYGVPMFYRLRDGSTLRRFYKLPTDNESRADPASDIRAWENINNLPEVRLKRVWADKALTADDIHEAWIEVRTPLDAQSAISNHIVLTPAQAVSLWREGIIPDAEAGNIARWRIRDSAEDDAERTNISVAIMCRVRREEGMFMDHLDEQVLFSSENTLRWLKENMGLTPSKEIHGGHDDQQLEIAALPIEQPQNQQQ